VVAAAVISIAKAQASFGDFFPGFPQNLAAVSASGGRSNTGSEFHVSRPPETLAASDSLADLKVVIPRDSCLANKSVEKRGSCPTDPEHILGLMNETC